MHLHISANDGVPIYLQIANQVKIDVSRTAIAALQPEESDASGKQGEGGKKK